MIDRAIVKVKIYDEVIERCYWDDPLSSRVQFINLNDVNNYDYDTSSVSLTVPEVLHDLIFDNNGSHFQLMSIITDPEDIDRILTMRELVE